jgi:hypothetical protein
MPTRSSRQAFEQLGPGKSELHKLGPLIDLDAIREQQGVEDRLPVTERTGAKQDERGLSPCRGPKGGPASPGA